MVAVDDGNTKIVIQKVADLYAEFRTLDDPSYYKPGEVNPYVGLTSLIPEKFTYFVQIPVDDPVAVEARQIMKRIAGRRKVREAVRTKREICYNTFARASNILILWV